MTGSANDPLGWAIVGPGRIAGVFAESLRDSRAGRIVLAYGRSPERLAAFCAAHGATPALDVRACVGSPEVDAVYVATPHSAHFEVVHAALRARKAVLCEKPLTDAPGPTEALVATARELRAPLVEAWMYRTHPQLARTLELVREGAIGRPRRIESHFCFDVPFDPASRLFAAELAGGGILDVGGYPVSFALAVAGAAGAANALAPEVTGAAGELAPTGVDTFARCTLRFADGLEAHLAAAVGRERGRGAVVLGEGGRIELEGPFLPGSQRRGRVTRIRIDTPRGSRVETLESAHDCFALEAFEVARLVRALRADADAPLEPAAPMVGHAETVAIARVCELWKRAIGAR